MRLGGIFAVLFFLPSLTYGYLGEKVQGPPAINSTGAFSVRETRTDANIIREFISAKGIVFGIRWEGLRHPSLEEALGSYFENYDQAAKRNPVKFGARHHEVETPEIVVKKWGHPRRLQGMAYAPKLLPQGVSANEIR